MTDPTRRGFIGLLAAIPAALVVGLRAEPVPDFFGPDPYTVTIPLDGDGLPVGVSQEIGVTWHGSGIVKVENDLCGVASNGKTARIPAPR